MVQVNPAVTLSLLATRRLDLMRALVYVGAQCLGASLGAGALYFALPLKTTADCFVSRVSVCGGGGGGGLNLIIDLYCYSFRLFVSFGTLPPPFLQF